MVLHKNQGSRLVEVNAAIINNKLRKAVIVTIKSVHKTQIAFKTSSNNLQLYFMKSNRGILLPGKTTIVDFEMKGNTTFHDFLSSTPALCFTVRAMTYPKLKDFNNDTWEKLEKSANTIMQLATLEMEADDFGLSDSANNKPIILPSDDILNPKITDFYVGDQTPKSTENAKEMETPETSLVESSVEKPVTSEETPKLNMCSKLETSLMNIGKVEDPPKRANPVPTNHPLLHVDPSVIEFKPPYNQNTKASVLIKCLGPRKAAYKVQSNAATWKLLNAIPSNGLLLPGKTKHVTFFVNDGIKEDEFINDDHAHLFLIHAIPWPPKLTEFDQEMFNNLLVVKKGEDQYLTVRMDIIKPERKGNELVSLNHAKVMFSPPFGFGSCRIEMKSLALKTVAFKVLANASASNFFAVSPTRGLLSADKPITLEFTINNKAALSELNIHPNVYLFKVEAINWLERFVEFDEEFWTQVADSMQGAIHNLELNVELDAGGSNAFRNVPVTDLIFRDSTPANEPKIQSTIEDLIKPSAVIAKEPIIKPSEVMLQEDKNADKSERKSEVKKETKQIKIVEMSTNTLNYKPPYGKKNQSIMLAAKNISPKTLAYKVQTNKKKFYNVKPVLGTLNAEETIHIDFEMTEKLTEEILKSSPAEHLFVFTAYADWKGDKKKIVNNVLKKIETDKPGNIQKETIVVVHEGIEVKGNAQSSKISTSPCKPMASLDPPNLSFKGPYGSKKLEVLNVISQSTIPLAFKLHCNKTQFYIVAPNRGLILPGKTIPINVELSEKFNDEEFKKVDQKRHKIQVLIIKWPTTNPPYDPSLWKKLTADMKKNMLTLGMDVQLN